MEPRESGRLSAGLVSGRLPRWQALRAGLRKRRTAYLQTTGFYVPEDSGEAARALAAHIARLYPDYTANIGLPAENVTVAAALEAQGYAMLDDCLDLRLDAARFQPADYGGGPVFRIAESTLPSYLAFHRLHFDDGYWTAERLRACFADWMVYALGPEARLTGGLFLRRASAEIFGLYTDDDADTLPLLAYAVGDLLAQGDPPGPVILMADAAETASVDAALSLGFRQASHYRSYTKRL